MNLALLVAAALTAASMGDPADEGLTIITSMSVRPDVCGRANAQVVEYAALLTEPQQYLGKCIAVRGYWLGVRLYLSRQEALKSDRIGDTEYPTAVGLYGYPRATPKRPQLRTAIGLFELCEDMRSPNVMHMGYCHYTDGPVLTLGEMRP